MEARKAGRDAPAQNETQMMRDRRLVYFGKEAQLRELLCHIHPDSSAGFVIRERLDELIKNGSNAEIFSKEHNATIRNQTLDAAIKRINKTLAVNWTPHRAGLEKAREVIKSLRITPSIQVSHDRATKRLQ